MLTLPDAIVSLVSLLTPFSALFQRRTWLKPQLLPAGAILSPGKRTVTSALRVMGLSDERGFAQYHHVLHVLNRAAWPPLRLGRTLLRLLLQHLDQGCGPWCSGLVFGIDETLERRRGRRIDAKGIHRDGVRSSGSHFVKASGLRRTSLMWLTATAIPWAGRTWALPFLTALAPSERYYRRKGRTPKKLPRSSPEAHRSGPSDYPPAATPSWNCSTSASRWLNRLRSSPDCGWMLRSMSRRRPAGRAGMGAPGSRASVCPS